MRIVVIGGGPAAASAIEAIRSIDHKSEIVLISDEKIAPITPVFLPEVAVGAVGADKLLFRDPAFLARHRVTPILGVKARRVDTRAKTVEIEGGEEIAYDVLLVAVGSRPLVPRVEGVNLDGVTTLHRPRDAIKIRELIPGVRRAAVIGAGAIGVEVAVAMHRAGLDVSLIELQEHVLPLVLDPELGAVVERYLEDLGIKLLLGRPVTEICGEEGRVRSVRAGDVELGCELVVLATGVRPNTDVVDRTAVSISSGILVDERMATTAKDVYAAGDVTEPIDFLGNRAVTPTLPNAIAQGRIAGLNIAGREARSPGSIRSNIIKGLDVPVVSIGYTAAMLKGRRFDEEIFKKGSVVKKAIYIGGRLVGFESVGSYSALKISGVLQQLMLKGVELKSKERELILKGSITAIRSIPFLSLL